jgi:hypothetical protein
MKNTALSRRSQPTARSATPLRPQCQPVGWVGFITQRLDAACRLLRSWVDKANPASVGKVGQACGLVAIFGARRLGWLHQPSVSTPACRLLRSWVDEANPAYVGELGQVHGCVAIFRICPRAGCGFTIDRRLGWLHQPSALTPLAECFAAGLMRPTQPTLARSARPVDWWRFFGVVRGLNAGFTDNPLVPRLAMLCLCGPICAIEPSAARISSR